MPLWTENWGLWVLIYLLAGAHMALYDLSFGWVGSTWLLIWLLAQHESIRASRDIHAASIAKANLGLQLSFMLLLGAWIAGWLWAGPQFWTLSMLLLVANIIGMLIAENKENRPLPIYSTEAFIIVCFSVAYMSARFRFELSPLVLLAIIHTAILCIALLRNGRIAVKHVYGPVEDGDHVRSEWQLYFQENRGWKAIARALTLPSGIIGASLVSLEIIILVFLYWR